MKFLLSTLTAVRLSALALTALATGGARADPISYSLALTDGSSGYIIVDDALARTFASGSLALLDIEVAGFGYQYGNDFRQQGGTVLHLPSNGGSVRFDHGVPVEFAYYEEHYLWGPPATPLDNYRTFTTVPGALAPSWVWPDAPPRAYLISSSDGDSRGTYQFGAPNAVPEPETWALMLTGVAALGASTRRRRSGERH